MKLLVICMQIYRLRDSEKKTFMNIIDKNQWKKRQDKNLIGVKWLRLMIVWNEKGVDLCLINASGKKIACTYRVISGLSFDLVVFFSLSLSRQFRSHENDEQTELLKKKSKKRITTIQQRWHRDKFIILLLRILLLCASILLHLLHNCNRFCMFVLCYTGISISTISSSFASTKKVF